MSCQGIEEAWEAGRRKLKQFLLENDSEKNTRAVLVGSQARPNQAQNWSWWAKNHCFIANLTNPINKLMLALIYLKEFNFSHHFLKLK